MNEPYLEVTYRKGKPLAAYLYLPRRTGDVSARVEPRGDGYLVDWAVDGRPIGIEMPSPSLKRRMLSVLKTVWSIGLNSRTTRSSLPVSAAFRGAALSSSASSAARRPVLG
jgi:hypothetical protein